MKKPCILRILANLIEHQAQLAEQLANPHVVDLSARKKLLGDIRANQMEFKNRLVPEFQIQVEKRLEPPKP